MDDRLSYFESLSVRSCVPTPTGFNYGFHLLYLKDFDYHLIGTVVETVSTENYIAVTTISDDSGRNFIRMKSIVGVVTAIFVPVNRSFGYSVDDLLVSNLDITDQEKGCLLSFNLLGSVLTPQSHLVNTDQRN